MKKLLHLNGVAVVFAVLFAAPLANAAFSLFENFESLNPGALSGQGPAGNLWTANTISTVATAGGDKVVNLATGGTGTLSNYRSLNPLGLSIPNSSTAATVYWNFSLSNNAGNNNWNFIVTDDAAPADTAGSSEVQLNCDTGNTQALRARSGTAFLNLAVAGSLFLPLSGIVYNAWFEINNSADTYQVFLQSDGDARVGTRTLLTQDGTGVSTFTFRNGVSTNPLTTINFGSASTGSVLQFDDIHVDAAGFNAVNPVPEPASAAFLAGGLAALCGFRRQRRK